MDRVSQRLQYALGAYRDLNPTQRMLALLIPGIALAGLLTWYFHAQQLEMVPIVRRQPKR